MNIEQETWESAALCKDASLDFYDFSAVNVASCVKMCNACPVQAECLNASMFPLLEDWGIWGGMRPEPRRSLRRRTMKENRTHDYY
jgi:hypothetical protein